LKPPSRQAKFSLIDDGLLPFVVSRVVFRSFLFVGAGIAVLAKANEQAWGRRRGWVARQSFIVFNLCPVSSLDIAA